MATRGVRKRGSVRVAYVGAAVCFTLAALAGAVAAAAATTNPVTTVSVRDYAFSPTAVTIVRDSDVRFTNTGQALHHVVSDDGTIDTHPLQPGHNATVRFATLGVFRLHCEIHPSMTMTVTVVASAPANAAPASGTNETATAAAPTAAPRTLPTTGAGTTLLSVIGLALILLGMACLFAGRSSLSTIPAVVTASPSAIARVMGWENRFDDLLPGRATDVLKR